MSSTTTRKGTRPGRPNGWRARPFTLPGHVADAVEIHAKKRGLSVSKLATAMFLAWRDLTDQQRDEYVLKGLVTHTFIDPDTNANAA